MENKPKVIVFSAFYSPYISGAELFVKEIVERLADKYDFYIITSRLSPKLSRLEIKEKYTIRRIGLGLAGDKFLFIFLAPLVALKYQPQIVHAVMESYAGIALWLFRVLNKKIPTILTLQSGDLDDPKKQKKIPRWLWRRIHLSPSRITAISNFLAKRAEKLGFPKRKISVIPNGVDLESGRKNVSRIPFRIICLARLSWEKGINFLIEALPKVRKKFPQAHLILVGDGPERKSLEKQVKKLDLEKTVEFKGKLAHPEALKELSQSAVFVCPSLAEGLGIVFIEAQACGLPTIGTKVGGISDIIEDNFNGLLISPKSSQAIAQAIIEIFSQPVSARKFVRNAQKTLKKFSWENITKQINQLYQELLNKNFLPKLVVATGIFPPDIGGPATYAEKIIIALEKKGLEGTIITYADTKGLLLKKDRPWPVIKISRKYCLPLRYFLYFWNLLKIAKPAGVIYVQGATISAGFPTVLANVFLRKKMILRIAGDGAWERAKTSDTLEEFQHKQYRAKIELIKKIQKLVCRKADKIITPSYFLKKIVSGWGIDTKKIKVVYNALQPLKEIDFSKEEAQRKINMSGDILLSVSRLVSWKGLGTLIEIMPDLLKENPNFKLVIIGSGPEKDNLEFKIKNLKLENKVFLLGQIPREELSVYFKAAEIFILNTSYEGLSHVILETMQMKLPVITTNIEGNAEIIQNGYNGILLDYNDKGQLKEAILRLWKDGQLKNKFVENSLKELKRFNFNRMINKTLRVLKVTNNDIFNPNKLH